MNKKPWILDTNCVLMVLLSSKYNSTLPSLKQTIEISEKNTMLSDNIFYCNWNSLTIFCIHFLRKYLMAENETRIVGSEMFVETNYLIRYTNYGRGLKLIWPNVFVFVVYRYKNMVLWKSLYINLFLVWKSTKWIS